jgi:hypothetical protein
MLKDYCVWEVTCSFLGPETIYTDGFFLGASWDMLGQRFKIGLDRFLPHLSGFITFVIIFSFDAIGYISFAVERLC